MPKDAPEKGDYTPWGARKALRRILRVLHKLSDKEAHDRLIKVMMRSMYDVIGDGDTCWIARSMEFKAIMERKHGIRMEAFGNYWGVTRSIAEQVIQRAEKK